MEEEVWHYLQTVDKSWTPMTDGIGFDSPSRPLYWMKIHQPGTGPYMWQLMGKGYFKSSDDGKTWELRDHGIEGSKAAFELTLLPDGTLFLVTSPTPQHQNGKEGREVFMGAVYKSIDGADTWQRLDLDEKTGFPNGLEYDPQNPKRLYLGSWADITLSDLIGGQNCRGNRRKRNIRSGWRYHHV